MTGSQTIEAPPSNFTDERHNGRVEPVAPSRAVVLRDISDSTGHWFGNSYPSNPGVQITGADHNHS